MIYTLALIAGYVGAIVTCPKRKAGAEGLKAKADALLAAVKRA